MGFCGKSTARYPRGFSWLNTVTGYFVATSALTGMVTSQLSAHNYPMPKSNSRSLKKQGSLVSQIWRSATYRRHDNQDLLKNSPQVRRSELISQAQPKLGSLLHNARLRTGLSFRAAAAISREIANLLGDERYYVSPGVSLRLRSARHSAPPLSQNHYFLPGLFFAARLDVGGSWSQPARSWNRLDPGQVR